MLEHEILYAHSSIAITGILLVLIMLANEIGFHTGRFIQNRTDSETKSLTGSVQASILGLLALLLGFTFSMSMQRYDNRNQAVIEEANAIGTAMLRVQLLPEQFQEEAGELMRKYVDLRIAAGTIDLTQPDVRKKFLDDTASFQNKIWAVAIAAANADPRPVTTGNFIKSINDVIDSQGRRNALLEMHVPEIVLLLLFTVFISSGGILGYSSGLSGQRIIAPTALVAVLISLIVFIIIDLDRPRRGLIHVNQGVMLELQQPRHTP